MLFTDSVTGNEVGLIRAVDGMLLPVLEPIVVSLKLLACGSVSVHACVCVGVCDAQTGFNLPLFNELFIFVAQYSARRGNNRVFSSCAAAGVFVCSLFSFLLTFIVCVLGYYY